MSSLEDSAENEGAASKEVSKYRDEDEDMTKVWGQPTYEDHLDS